jgi:hypothetical protein
MFATSVIPSITTGPVNAAIIHAERAATSCAGRRYRR